MRGSSAILHWHCRCVTPLPIAARYYKCQRPMLSFWNLQACASKCELCDTPRSASAPRAAAAHLTARDAEAPTSLAVTATDGGRAAAPLGKHATGGPPPPPDSPLNTFNNLATLQLALTPNNGTPSPAILFANICVYDQDVLKMLMKRCSAGVQAQTSGAKAQHQRLQKCPAHQPNAPPSLQDSLLLLLLLLAAASLRQADTAVPALW